MDPCYAIGALAKIAVQDGATPRTFSDASERYDFSSEEIVPNHTFSGRSSGIGEIGRAEKARRRKLTYYSGNIRLPATPRNMSTWLPRAMWGAAASGNNPLAYEFDTLINRENGVYRYENCLVDSLTIYSDVDLTIAQMIVGIVASRCSETADWPAPEPALTLDPEDYPYTHYELNVELDNEPILVERISTTIWNRLYPVANASVNPQRWRSNGRSVKCAVVGAFNSTDIALAEQSLDGRVNGLIEYSSSALGFETSLSLANGQNSGHTHPNAKDRNTIPMSFVLEAGKSDSATPELQLTHQTI